MKKLFLISLLVCVGILQSFAFEYNGRNRQTLWGGCTDANPKLLLNDT